jgi:hypothetical protein
MSETPNDKRAKGDPVTDPSSKKMRFPSENKILPFIDEENKKLLQLIKLNEEKKREIDLMIT